MKIQSVAVFCGSRDGNNPIFAQHAAELGKLIAVLGLKLVYGGGANGLMGIIANEVMKHEGKVIGVIPKVLIEWEAQHKGLKELSITPDMHSRKKMMYDLCDAAIVLPGGFGTLPMLPDLFGARVSTGVVMECLNPTTRASGCADVLIDPSGEVEPE